MDSAKAERFDTLLSGVLQNEQGFPVKVFLVACKVCGALVLFETRESHLNWHDLNTREPR
jgi:hypothetical protein